MSNDEHETVPVVVVRTETYTIWPGGCNIYERLPHPEYAELPRDLPRFYAHGSTTVGMMPNGMPVQRQYLVELDAENIDDALAIMDACNKEACERTHAEFKAEVEAAAEREQDEPKRPGLVDAMGRSVPLRPTPGSRNSNNSGRRRRQE